jgi:nitrate/nitrite-specific signal transduction histidine kinase
MKEWFERQTMQRKLFGMFSLIILLGTLLTIWNIISVIGIDQAANELVASTFRMGNFEEMQLAFLRQQLTEQQYLLTGNEKFIYQHESATMLVGEFLQNSLMAVSAADERNTLYELQSEDSDHNQVFSEIVTAYQSNDRQEAQRLSTDVSEPGIEKVHSIIEQMLKKDEQEIQGTGIGTDIRAIFAISISLLGMATFLLSVNFIMRTVVTQIAQPILALCEAIRLIGEGVFAPAQLQELTGRADEIGRMARAIEEMSGSVLAHEKEMAAQALELRRQIEHARRP